MSVVAAEPLARRLLDVLAGHEPGLGVLYAILDAAVAELGLREAALVLDVPPFERQLFRAGRTLHAEDGLLAMGPPGLYTEPPVARDGEVARAVADACRVALRQFPASETTSSAIAVARNVEREFEISVAHALRSGCAFTFVLVKAGEGAERHEIARHLERALRRDDAVHAISPVELTLLMPLVHGDRVAAVLERAAAGRSGSEPCPPFTYSVVGCPEEAAAFDVALTLARERHQTVAESLAEGRPKSD